MGRCRIVIVGAGFGGLQVAKSLRHSGADVVLVDRKNYHGFVPLLYQVATAQIAPSWLARSVRSAVHLPVWLRDIVSKRAESPVEFLMSAVQRVDLQEKVVETRYSEIAYDYLVLATGSRPRYLNIPGAWEYSFPLGTLPDAIALRNHLISRFEQATQERDVVSRRQLLTIAIVGGGSTGIELAGSLVELSRCLIPRYYPQLERQQVHIVLLHSGDRLLLELPAKLGFYTQKRLQQLGVEVRLQTKVVRVTNQTVSLVSGETIQAGTIIWAAGQEATHPWLAPKPPTAQQERLIVEPTLQLADYPEVYAIGDLAYLERQGKPLEGVAPVALQQGVAVARNIRRQMQGRDPKPFHYFNKGRLAIIGCRSGVGQVGPISLTGWLPWLMWLAVHWVYLPGIRNRVFIFLGWLQNYVMGDRPMHLLIQPRDLNDS
jgi:NADH dehydrogenase